MIWSVEAVVVGGVDYGESDRIVHLLTPSLGRVSAFARGAKKSKRRFAGALDLFTRVRVELTRRPSAEMYTLVAADVLEAHLGISADLLCIAHAGYASELARDFARDAAEATRLYDALVAFLHRLAAGPTDADALCAFELHALAAVGLAPALSRCARCGGELGPRPGFDPMAGGATCLADSVPGTGVPPALLARLAALAAGAPAGAEQAQPSRNLVRRFVLHHLDRQPRSLKFLEEAERDARRQESR